MMDLTAIGLAEADLPDRFRRFALRETMGISPLYEAMAHAAAEMPQAMALAALRQEAQPPVNMLFGAIHRLLLGGDLHPIRAFYPTLTDRPLPPSGVGPLLADYIATRAEPLAALIAARRVSTNEIGRSAALALAIGAGLRAASHEGPLALLDVGASAGLNLYPDRLGFDLGGGRRGGAPDGALVLPCDLQPVTAVLTPLPPVVSRTGVDLHPLDPADPEDAAWLRALVWPDAPDRLARLDAALALARAEPARMVKGDAVAEIAGLIAGQPAEALACVSHSIMLYQLPEPQRAAFADRLKAASHRRPVLRAAFEGHRGSEYPVVSATLYRGGAVVWHRDLAKGNPHGRWLSML